MFGRRLVNVDCDHHDVNSDSDSGSDTCVKAQSVKAKSVQIHKSMHDARTDPEPANARRLIHLNAAHFVTLQVFT